MNARILSKAEVENQPDRKAILRRITPKTDRRCRTIVITAQGRAYLAEREKP